MTLRHWIAVRQKGVHPPQQSLRYKTLPRRLFHRPFRISGCKSIHLIQHYAHCSSFSRACQRSVLWLLSAQMVSVLDKEDLLIAHSTSYGEDGKDAVQARPGNTHSTPIHNPSSATPDPHIPDRHVELSPSTENCAQEENLSVTGL